MKSDKFASIKKRMDEITVGCASDSFIFRGTNQAYNGTDKVNSLIYRNQRNVYRRFGRHFLPIELEEVIVKKAKPYFKPDASNVEILTDLRHFGGETTLIDFSRNLLVALYFACNGKSDIPGQIIALRTEKIPVQHEIDYEKKETLITSIINPARTSRSFHRSQAQGSVFVHAPNGFIHEKYWIPFKIPPELKIECLDYLKKVFNINTKTIYNDWIGFLSNEDNYILSVKKMYSGLAEIAEGYYEEAINNLDEAIRFAPDLAQAYYGRGYAKVELQQNEKAIIDFDEAIRLIPDFADAYYNRGKAKESLNRSEDAINDLDKALQLDPAIVDAYYLRGKAKESLDRWEEAINDLDKALKLNPYIIHTYYLRGIANASLYREHEAINDLDEAIRRKPNDDKYFLARGHVKEIFNRKNEALIDYNEAIRLNSNNGDAYYARGLLKKQLGDLEGSKADIERASELGLE